MNSDTKDTSANGILHALDRAAKAGVKPSQMIQAMGDLKTSDKYSNMLDMLDVGFENNILPSELIKALEQKDSETRINRMITEASSSFVSQSINNTGIIPPPLIHIDDYSDSDEIGTPTAETKDSVKIGTPTVKTNDSKDPKDSVKIMGMNNLKYTVHEDCSIDVNFTFDVSHYTCCACVFEKITSDIVCCVNMHPLCDECAIKLKGNPKCPICRDTNPRVKNVLLKKILDVSVINNCTNDGCKHKLFAEDMGDHMKTCPYTEIKCPWCEGKTTPFDLKTHCEFECKYQFKENSCSSNFSGLLSSAKIGDSIVQSVIEKSRFMFIRKTENNTCELMCVQYREDDTDNLGCISMKCEFETESLDGTIIESKIINIPIHKPKHLIDGKCIKKSIAIADCMKQESITVNGFKDKYMVGQKWTAEDSDGEWLRATIIEIKQNPHRVKIKFDGQYSDDRHDEIILIFNNHSDRLKPIKYRTTSEQRTYIRGLSDEEQVALAISRSNDDQ